MTDIIVELAATRILAETYRDMLDTLASMLKDPSVTKQEIDAVLSLITPKLLHLPWESSDPEGDQL
jgi:hypothetical protein